MDYVLDVPLAIREEKGNLARKINRISKKVQAQALLRHPEDWKHLPDLLREAADDLEVLMDKIENLSHNPNK